MKACRNSEVNIFRKVNGRIKIDLFGKLGYIKSILPNSL